MLTVTTELPLPDGTCEGLKLHEAKAGKPEQDRLTVFGKFPGLGFTVTLNKAGLPRTTATVGGAAVMEKLKFGFGIAVKVNATECVVFAVSVPTALRWNGYACDVALLTSSVNGAPEALGTIVDGVIKQVGGAPLPQLRVTLLVYPLAAVRTPSNVAVAFTWADKVGLLTVRA